MVLKLIYKRLCVVYIVQYAHFVVTVYIFYGPIYILQLYITFKQNTCQEGRATSS